MSKHEALNNELVALSDALFAWRTVAAQRYPRAYWQLDSDGRSLKARHAVTLNAYALVVDAAV